MLMTRIRSLTPGTPGLRQQSHGCRHGIGVVKQEFLYLSRSDDELVFIDNIFKREL